MSTLRRLVVVTFLTAIMVWASPVPATTITYATTLSPPPPTEVTLSNLVTFSFDVGQHFSQLQSVTFESEFVTDLWDPGEEYLICIGSGCIGQINQSTTSIASAEVTAQSNFTFSPILSGDLLTFRYTMAEPGQSVELAAVTVTVNGTTPIPEPSSAALLIAGCLALSAYGIRRRELPARTRMRLSGQQL